MRFLRAGVQVPDAERYYLHENPWKNESWGMPEMDQMVKEMDTILTDLGFGVTRGDTWTVSVPSFRRDAVGGADLVEEIARIHGFHNLEAVSLPPLPGRREPTATRTQNRTRLARRALALQGLSEAITWSFVLEDHA